MHDDERGARDGQHYEEPPAPRSSAIDVLATYSDLYNRPMPGLHLTRRA